MAKQHILGIFDFRITAEKVRDFLLKNDFIPDEVVIYEIRKGQHFNDSETDIPAAPPPAISKLPAIEEKPTANEQHTILNFFKHIFHLDGRRTNKDEHVVADRDGYILCVHTDGEEEAMLAKEILKDRGAAYIKDFLD